MEEYKMFVNRNSRQAVLSLDKGIRIGLESEDQQHIFDDISGPHKVIRLGSWLLERTKGTIGIRNLRSTPAEGDTDSGKLMVYFQGSLGQETAAVKIIFLEKEEAGQRQKMVSDTVRVIVFAGDTMQLLSANDPEVENSTGSEPGTSLEGENTDSASANNLDQEPSEEVRRAEETFMSREREYRERIRDLEEAFASREKEYRDRIRDLEEENRKLNTENDAFRANRALTGQAETESGELEKITQETVEADTQLKRIRRELAQSREELRQKKEELRKSTEEKESAEIELAQSEKDQKKREEELAVLRTQLDQLRERSEVSELDVSSVSEEIRAMKERLAEDTLSVTTMEEDSLIGTGTVKASLKKAEEELERAEKKIGLIIRLRETINDRVQEAVVRKGTGFLTVAGETGGE